MNQDMWVRCTMVLLFLALARSSIGLAAEAGEPYSHYEAEVDRLIEKGDGYVEAGKHGKAVQWYLDAFELMPLPGLLEKIASCYLAIGQEAQAEQYYRKHLAMLHGIDDEQ
ncbi:MAG: hypothetical protein JRG91_15975, partial [Deltaproteobacteria bacterium]|nr:hypothetical protein [Deltaproteobacteria bacterium]